MNAGLMQRVRAAMRSSDLLRAAASVRADGGVALALGGDRIRALTPDEVARLEGQGNAADDWSRVRVADGFDPRRVWRSSFHGDIVLGRFVGRVAVAAGVEVPAGVSDSAVADSVVGHGALVRQVRLLAGCVVGQGAALFDCGRVVGVAGGSFGNGAARAVSLEGGGRTLALFAELDVESAAAALRPGARKTFPRLYAEAVAWYKEQAACPRGVVERGARVTGTGRVEGTYVGPFAVIDGATAVCDSTLLSSADEPARVELGACVRGALLQRGSRVSTLAVVEGSLLAEHASVERHGKVTDSVLGPGTAVGAGEVTSCLLGPLVAAHHQSLLISTFWPGGRGNVASGANVGSNHTSRAPDQELWAGEGLFFGLGVNVQFPCDLSRAPYTVVACGGTLPAQKVTFPFSLIAPPAAGQPGAPPGRNEILPGWMLGENLYALRRCEAKFRARDRSGAGHAVLRPDTVDLVRDACRVLEAVRETRDTYTEKDIAGLGKNVLTERARLRGIEAYRLHVRAYALLGLKGEARAALRSGTRHCRRLLTTPSADATWEHQRQLLHGELGVRCVTAALAEVPALARALAAAVERSRAKDDERGRRILDDYAAAHPAAADDELVRRAWDEAQRVEEETAALTREWLAADEDAAVAGGLRA